LTKKRGASLKSYRIQESAEEYDIEKTESIINLYEHTLQQPINQEEEKCAVKQWLADRLKDKLQRASAISLHIHKPVMLFRKIIEETENAVEEEIGYISGNHIVCMTYVYGGFIPSSFKSIEVFTRDKFTKWILQERKKDMLLQCIEELEQQNNKQYH
jgi:hypothetical protein